MSAVQTRDINSIRYVQAGLSAHEATVFDRLCEQSGLSPSAVGSAMVAFVCRSISGARDVKNGDVDALLADEFGDLRALLSRVRATTIQGERAIETLRALAALVEAELPTGSRKSALRKT
jgi:hypothetical protein